MMTMIMVFESNGDTAISIDHDDNSDSFVG